MVRKPTPACGGPARRTPEARVPRVAQATTQCTDVCVSIQTPFRRRRYRQALKACPGPPREMFCLHGRPPRSPVHRLSRWQSARTPSRRCSTEYISRSSASWTSSSATDHDERRRLRLLLRGATGLRGGRPAAHPARLLGARSQELAVLRLPLETVERVGQGGPSSPQVSSSTASWSPTTSSTSTSGSGSCWASFPTTAARVDERPPHHPRPTGQPGRHPPSLEPSRPCRNRANRTSTSATAG